MGVWFQKTLNLLLTLLYNENILLPVFLHLSDLHSFPITTLEGRSLIAAIHVLNGYKLGQLEPTQKYNVWSNYYR